MKDVLVVGYGIAGLSVAVRLKNQKKSFDVIADDSQHSSRVAGGILNPVVLKRYNLAWNAQEFMPEALQFYSELTANNPTFFQHLPVFKLFSSVEDQNNWMVATDHPKLTPFLEADTHPVKAQVRSPFKAGRVLQTRLLHLKKLLNAEQKKLEEASQFYNQTFVYDDLIIKSDYVIYNEKEYRAVVFCEGFGVTKNPFFNWLPLYGNKGEYLIFKSKSLQANRSIFKSRNFIIPLGDDIYKYGATYSRETLNHDPTSEARNQLVKQLSEMIQCDFEVIDQQAGIRPTVRDRKPLVGAHPDYKNLYVLNGFGSRGVMAAPHLSRQLIDLMYSDSEVDDEVSINRFLKHFV